MEYPKAMMKIKELMDMGIPESMLMNAYRYPGQEFAQKINPKQKNSPIVFDTEGFDKWRVKMLRAENKAIIRG